MPYSYFKTLQPLLDLCPANLYWDPTVMLSCPETGTMVLKVHSKEEASHVGHMLFFLNTIEKICTDPNAEKFFKPFTHISSHKKFKGQEVISTDKLLDYYKASYDEENNTVSFTWRFNEIPGWKKNMTSGEMRAFFEQGILRHMDNIGQCFDLNWRDPNIETIEEEKVKDAGKLPDVLKKLVKTYPHINNYVFSSMLGFSVILAPRMLHGMPPQYKDIIAAAAPKTKNPGSAAKRKQKHLPSEEEKAAIEARRAEEAEEARARAEARAAEKSKAITPSHYILPKTITTSLSALHDGAGSKDYEISVLQEGIQTLAHTLRPAIAWQKVLGDIVLDNIALNQAAATFDKDKAYRSRQETFPGERLHCEMLRRLQSQLVTLITTHEEAKTFLEDHVTKNPALALLVSSLLETPKDAKAHCTQLTRLMSGFTNAEYAELDEGQAPKLLHSALDSAVKSASMHHSSS